MHYVSVLLLVSVCQPVSVSFTCTATLSLCKMNFYKEINIQKNTRDFLQVYTVRVWMWKMCIFFVWVSKLHLSFDLLLHIWIMLVHNTEVRLYLSKPLSLLSHWYLFAHNWNTNKRELYLSDTSFFIQLWKETLELTFFFCAVEDYLLKTNAGINRCVWVGGKISRTDACESRVTGQERKAEDIYRWYGELHEGETECGKRKRPIERMDRVNTI